MIDFNRETKINFRGGAALLRPALKKYIKWRRERNPTLDVWTVQPRVERLIAYGGFTALGDVTPERMADALDRLRREGKANGTLRRDFAAFKSFARWLSDRVGSARSPTDGCAPPADDGTRLRQRRVAFPGEIERLCAAAEAADDPLGRDRSLVYRLAAQAGLRLGEIARLTRDSYFLDYGILIIEADPLKPRRRLKDKATQLPIHPELLAWLRLFFENRDFAWWVPRMFTRCGHKRHQIWSMMIQDMAAARAQCDSELLAEYPGYLERTNPLGRHFDILALRHTYLTRLVQAGCPLEVFHKLARYAKAKHSLAYYPDLDLEAVCLDDMKAAVAKLGSDDSPA